MARLAGVWVEMLWPLDEGAVVPPCVRTVDQGAPDGGYRACGVVQRPACVCCVGEAVLACAGVCEGAACVEREGGEKGVGGGAWHRSSSNDQNEKSLVRCMTITGPHACVWPAWRSIGSRSGHTVGGMCMQPAGVAIAVVRCRPPCSFTEGVRASHVLA
jgi:hypothetical protein